MNSDPHTIILDIFKLVLQYMFTIQQIYLVYTW